MEENKFISLPNINKDVMAGKPPPMLLRLYKVYKDESLLKNIIQIEPLLNQFAPDIKALFNIIHNICGASKTGGMEKMGEITDQMQKVVDNGDMKAF
jgi:hypothetical protein